METVLNLKMFRLTVFVPLIFLFGCEESVHTQSDSWLIFSSGDSRINAVHMSDVDGPRYVVYEGKSETGSINNIVRAGRGKIVFDECDGLDGCQLKRYGLFDKKLEELRPGSLPSYIPGHKRLLFYDADDDGKVWLYSAPVSNLSQPRKLARKPESITLPNGFEQPVAVPPVQISRNKFAYVGGRGELVIGDVRTTDNEEFQSSSCLPMLWIKSRRQLLCVEPSAWVPYFLDLSTGDREPAELLEGAYGFTLEPGSDSVLFGVTESKWMVSESYNVYLYDFDRHKSSMLIRNVHLSTGVVVNRKPTMPTSR